MTDYISRQAAIEALAGWKISPIVLEPVPSADVVEVVRCKDCKYWDNTTKWSVCTKWSADPYEQANTEKNDFCNYGERAEENELKEKRRGG